MSQLIDSIGYVSLPLPIFKNGEAVYLLRKFYGLGGKDLAPCSTLRGRSKKENKPVFLVFPGCPKHLSTADIDKISSKASVNQAAVFKNIRYYVSHTSM